MANIKVAYGGDTSITLSSAGPTNGSDSTSSSAIDNSTNLYMDALIKVKFTTAGSATSATGHVDVYVQPSEDGTDYTDATNDVLVVSVAATSNTTTYVGTTNVAQCTGGAMPYKWKVRIRNNTGATISSLTCNYNGVYTTVV